MLAPALPCLPRRRARTRLRNMVGYLGATPILPIQWVSVLWTVTLDIYKFLFLPAFSAISLYTPFFLPQ